MSASQADFARRLARGVTADELVPLLVRTCGSSRLVMQTHLVADRHRFCPVCVAAVEEDHRQALQLQASMADGLGASDGDLVGDE